MTSPFLTTRELAARWRTTPQAIHMIRHRGEGPPAVRVQHGLLFRLTDVEAYEAKRVEERDV